MSGTPVENRPAELWSVFDFLMREHLGRYSTVVRESENRIMAGDQQVSNRPARRVEPFLLRRTKQAVASDLPEKIEIDEWFGLTAVQCKFYGDKHDETGYISSAILRGEYINYAETILPVLIKLKQICDRPALLNRNGEPLYRRSQKSTG